MFLFIICSLVLAFIVQTSNPWLALLVDPMVFYTALTVAALAMVAVIIKKGPIQQYYDVFASSALVAWYAHWQPIFNDDSPVLFAFPVYFVFMAAFIELAMLKQRQRVDDVTYQHMQALAKKSRVQPWLVMVGVLVSLNLDDHYMLYPVMMTVLMIRFALFRYLNNRD